MNQDDPFQVIPKGHHYTARNITFWGNTGNMRAENILGNTLVPNSYLPSGTNKTIGVHYDAVNRRVFLFNYNSNGNHGIYIYNTSSSTFQRLLQSNTGTDGDILAFNANVYITSINIIYGDATAGDILFFLDSLGRPTKINIQRYLAGTYATVKRNYIDVAKAPPVMPAKAVYENDTSVTVNNLRNSLFQFIYRFYYDDNDTSVWSSGSITPLPDEPFDDTTDTNPANNSVIALYFSTGDVNVKKIEIAVRQTKDGVTSNYLSVAVLDKTANSISNNTIYRYQFYNNGTYIPINQAEQALLYDYVPQQANAQELLDGNVVSYAGITEGYNPVTPSISSSVSSLAPASRSMPGTLFFAAANGLESGVTATQMTIYLTGTGTSGLLNKNVATYQVKVLNASGADISFGYHNTNTSAYITTILSALGTSAGIQGFSVVSSTSTSITLSLSGGFTLVASGYTIDLTDAVNYVNFYKTGVNYSMTPKGAYSYGVQYFDSKGVTNGVIQNINWNIVTPDFSYSTLFPYLPFVQLTINHRPPTWASYYQFVRTNNLTYNKRFYWVSNSAFSDTAQAVTKQYAYIGISNIFDYNQNIKAAEGVVQYGFSQGDRIKFIAVTHVDGTQGTYSSNSFDYPVLDVATNPVINGVTQVGTFVKIAYPTNDISVNFKFDGSDDYQNYSILLYSLQQQVQNKEQNVYYEFGKCFGIGNAGTNTAYHMAFDQCQSPDLVTPAGQSFDDGDEFFRYRNVYTGNTYYINADSFTHGNGYATYLTRLDTTVSNSVYEVLSQTNHNATITGAGYPQFADTNYMFYNKSASAIQIRLRGEHTLQTSVSQPTTAGVLVKVVDSSNNVTITNFVKNFNLPQGENITVYDCTFDGTVSVPAGCKAWLLSYTSDAAATMRIGSFTLRLDVIKYINIPIIEDSYSDIYAIRTNSDSRPTAIDANASQSFYSTLFRFSQPYQLNTNINGTNRFYPLDYDEFDKRYGAVQRMKLNGRNLVIYQERKTGVVGVYNKFIKNAQGESQLIVTDTIITPNNIQYYEADYGIGNQSASLTSDGNVSYFIDPIKARICRLSQNGITAISEELKMQTWVGGIASNYLGNYAYQFGGYAKIISCWNVRPNKESEFITTFQSGTGLQGDTLLFNESRNAFTSFADFNPDNLVCAEDLLISFYGGNLYTHNSTTRNNFYGTQYNSNIKIISNETANAKKQWKYMGYNSAYNHVWTADVVETELGQQSNLVFGDFDFREGIYSAGFWADTNSINGLINGDYLRGVWISVDLVNSNTDLSYLYGIYIGFSSSPKNY